MSGVLDDLLHREAERNRLALEYLVAISIVENIVIYLFSPIFSPSLIMAPRPGALHPVWAHFRTDGDRKYKNDRDHKAAWCNCCFESSVSQLQTREENAHLLDPHTAVRSSEDIQREGGQVEYNLNVLLAEPNNSR